MKVFRKKSIGCSKKFAAKAAMYRRLAKGMGGKSTFETMRQRNGFAFGKWLRDIDIAQYIEDLRTGMINPKELLEGVSIVYNKGFEMHFNYQAYKKNWIDLYLKDLLKDLRPVCVQIEQGIPVSL